MAHYQEWFLKVGSINKINWPGNEYSFGIGRVIETHACRGKHENNDLVFFFSEDDFDGEVLIKHKEQYVSLPDMTDLAETNLLMPLAFALWAWERLNLEIGEIALVTGDNVFSGVFAQAARLYGALPVFQLGNDLKDFQGIDNIEINRDEPLATIELLRNRIQDKAGFAAIDLSGKPEIIDVIFEVLPKWGKIMLLKQAEYPLTIDYYNNLHRKGICMFSYQLNPVVLFENKLELASIITRACRITQSRTMSKSFLGCLPTI